LFIALLSRWLDYTELKQTAGRINLGFFLLSLGLVLLNEFIIAIRLKGLMQSMKLRLSLARVIKIGFMSRFYAVFLPSGIGLLLARWYKVTENRVERLDFAAVTLTEKVLFVSVTLITVALPVLLFPDIEIRSIYLPLVSSIIILFLIVATFLSFCTGQFGTRRIPGILERLLLKITNRQLTPLSALQTALMNVFSSPWRIARAGFLSLLIQVGIILRIGLLIMAVGASLPWSTVLWLGSFIFFIQIIPVSFSGLGVRESAFAFSFELYGLQAEEGTVVGLLFFIQALTAAGIGGVLEFFDRGHPD
jgi:hypothetical protein